MGLLMAKKKTETAHEPSAADRYLILMRHAKSDWGDESLSDHQRPLNHRGKRDAPRMADWLAKIDVVPDRILSSSAERTRETVARMIEQWEGEPNTSFCDELYLATPESILSTIRADACDATKLMVVGHNPGITQLVSGLAEELIDMPTAAVAVFRIATSGWSDLRTSTPMSLTQFMRPKAL